MKPTTVLELQDLVREYDHLAPVGGRSKTGLHPIRDGVTLVDLTSLSGLSEYHPAEFTFTALAGTRVAEVEKVLSEQNQYLPFDPMLVEQGATLGGTVASGLSGSGRYRYGGVRDFLLGVQFVDGQGRLVRGGGKVVKNAAGFDLPKLMVGSLGRYGALTELSFKVFPNPGDFFTVRADFPMLEEALEAQTRLTQAPLDIFALDLESHGGDATLLVRVVGFSSSFPERANRIQRILGRGEIIKGEEEFKIWEAVRESTWVPKGSHLVKIPLTPRQIPGLDEWLEEVGATRRYSVGGNVGWVAWQGSIGNLNTKLIEGKLSGLVVLGKGDTIRLGIRTGESLARRIKGALDPDNRWMEV